MVLNLILLNFPASFQAIPNTPTNNEILQWTTFERKDFYTDALVELVLSLAEDNTMLIIVK